MIESSRSNLNDFAEWLRATRGIELSAKTRRILSRELHRFGSPSDQSDLLQLLVIELLEQPQIATDAECLKAVRRVRQRLYRRFEQLSRADVLSAEETITANADDPSWSAMLAEAIASLTTDDAWLLEQYAFEGRSKQEIADDIGISVAEVYRRIQRLKRHMERFIETPQ